MDDPETQVNLTQVLGDLERITRAENSPGPSGGLLLAHFERDSTSLA
jgi:hypothetical protein